MSSRSETQRPYRILHMLPDLATGGGQIILLNNISHMDRRRFRNLVCYVRPENDLESDFNAAGFQTFCLDHGAGRGIRTLLRLVRLIRRERVDIIHTNNTRTDRIYGQMAALLTGLPVVNYLLMPSARPVPGSLLGRPRGLFEYWLWRRTVRHVIALSHEVRRTWTEYNRTARSPNQAVSVVYAGVDLDAWEPDGRDAEVEALRRELGLDGAGPVFLNVGRLVPQKGQPFLVPVMSEVVRSCPEARLLVVGDGEMRSQLEDQIRDAGMQEFVRLLGTRHDVPALLALSDVFLFPSVAEGQGLAIVEAMAMARPVVAFRIAPLTEFIEDEGNGYLVDPWDLSAFARAVVDLAGDRGLARRFGRRGRRIAGERFDIREIARQIEDVYISVLEGEGRQAEAPPETLMEPLGTADER